MPTALDWTNTQPSGIRDCLEECERQLCALRPGCDSFAHYLGAAAGSGALGPCTAVWAAGAAAYRCRDCGLTPSSALCVDCFNDGDHEGHDVQMYVSDAGGCCDCGDAASLNREGSCPRHRPSDAPRPPPPQLPAPEAVTLLGAVGCALARLSLAATRCAHGAAAGFADPAAAARERAVAASLLRWLHKLAGAEVLREVVCAGMAREARQAGGAPVPAGLGEQLADADADADAGVDPTALPAQTRAPRSHLDLLLRALGALGAEGTEAAATLLTLLLYNDPFKLVFGAALVGPYAALASQPSRQGLARALDRLTVQVFNSEAAVLAVQDQVRLVDVLAAALQQVVEGARAAGVSGVDVEQWRVAGMCYLRPALDLHQALAHPRLLPRLLPGRSAALPSLLAALAGVEGSCPAARQRGDHVLFEDTHFVRAVELEAQVMGLVVTPAAGAALAGAARGQLSAGEAGSFLLECLQASVRAASQHHAADHDHVLRIWGPLLDGQRVSVHLPLQRAAAAFLVHLNALVQERGGAAARRALPAAVAAGPGGCAALGAALGAGPEATAEAGWLSAERGVPAEPEVEVWCILGSAALRVLAWMSQIQARLWARNGAALSRLPALYESETWAPVSRDADLVALQAWAATTRRPELVLRAVMCAHGGEALWAEAAGAAAPPPPGAAEPHAQCVGDGLALLVSIAGERAPWEPPGSAARVRRAVVRALAVGACGRSALEEAVGPEAARSAHLAPALAQLAQYSPPEEDRPGRYTLRREAWAAHFSPRDWGLSRAEAQAAVHEAQKAGTWQPAWQLAPPPPPPPALRGLGRMLRAPGPAACRLACAALRRALGQPPGAAPGAAMGALGLLSLALHEIYAPSDGGGDGDGGAGEAAGPGGEAEEALSRVRGEVVALAAGPSPSGGPGMLSLLRAAAGAAPEGGQRWEGGWEVAACAAHLADRVAALLAAGSGGPPGAAAAAAAAPEAAGVVGPGGGEGGEADVERERRRKAARERQARVQQQMRDRQARFASAAAAEAPEPAAAVEAAGPAAPLVAVPCHHPLSWSHVEGECAACHCGAEAGPLGWLTQLHVSNLPDLANFPTPPSVDAARAHCQPPYTPPLLFGGGAVLGGPRLGVFDVQPGLHALCCGHMMHASCYTTMQESVRERAFAGQEVPGDRFLQQLDPDAEVESICPCCRRMVNALLPVTAPAAGEGAGIPAAGASVLVAESGWSAEADLASFAAPPPALASMPHALLPGLEALGPWVAGPPCPAQLQQQDRDSDGAARVEGQGLESATVAEARAALRRLVGCHHAVLSITQRAARRVAAAWPGLRHAGELGEWCQEQGAGAMARWHPRPLIFEHGLDMRQAADWHGLRLTEGTSGSAVHWALVGFNVAQWEAARRPAGPGQGPDDGLPPAVDAAHWRAMQALAHVALAAGPAVGCAKAPPPPRAGDAGAAAGAASLLPWLLGLDQAPEGASVEVVVEVVHIAQALCPRWEQAWRPPAGAAAAAAAAVPGEAALRTPPGCSAFTPSLSQIVVDPFLLLLEVVAAAAAPRAGGAPAAPRVAALAEPARAVQAALPAVLAIAVAQAAVLATESSECHGSTVPLPSEMSDRELADPAGRPPAAAAALYSQNASAAFAACVALAQGRDGGAQETLQDALCSLLLPLLRRARVLLALCRGEAPPPLPAQARPAEAAAVLLRDLGLPGVLETLRTLGELPRPLTMLHRVLGGGAFGTADASALQRAPLLSVAGLGLAGVRPAAAFGGFDAQPGLKLTVAPAPAPPRLLSLPAAYQPWFLELSKEQCGACGRVPQELALCLRCGAAMCCGGQGCEGPAEWGGICFTHAQVCGAGTAVFLLARDTRVLAVRGARATLLPSPYLDAHGEEDVALRRGRPLRLSAPRAARVAQLWRGGALDFDTRALHAANVDATAF